MEEEGRRGKTHVEEENHDSVLKFLDEHFFTDEPFTRYVYTSIYRYIKVYKIYTSIYTFDQTFHRSLGITTNTFLTTSMLKKFLRFAFLLRFGLNFHINGRGWFCK